MDLFETGQQASARNHSHRKATIGFTLVADLAGMRAATIATATSRRVTSTAL
jgi:hypothetical protein